MTHKYIHSASNMQTQTRNTFELDLLLNKETARVFSSSQYKRSNYNFDLDSLGEKQSAI